MMKTYELLSAVLRAKASRSFQIPSLIVREDLERGDFAKLIFVSPGEPAGERMWVRVTGRTATGRYEGVLHNDAVTIQGLCFGEEVRFGPEHVADVRKPAEVEEDKRLRSARFHGEN